MKLADISNSARDYQREQIAAAVLSRRNGSHIDIIGSPVGSGKGFTIGELMRLGSRPLAVLPNLNLLNQMHQRVSSHLEEDIDVEQAERRVSNSSMHRTRAIVASAMSIWKDDRWKKFLDRSIWLIDEFHLGNTERRQKILKVAADNGVYVVGLTATPFTSKGLPLDNCPTPCYWKTYKDFIDDRWLVPPKITMLEPKSYDYTIFDEITFNEYNCDELLSEEGTVHEFANAVMQYYNQEPSAVYVSGVKVLKRLVEVFKRYGVQVSAVWGNQPPEDRQVNMEAFLNGDTKIIVNVGVLSYGWDFPELRNVFGCAPTRSLSNMEQRLGRLSRPLSGVLNNDMSQEQRREAIANSSKAYGRYFDLTHSTSGIKLCTPIDVFDNASREDNERREKMVAAATGEDVDVLEVIEETADDIRKQEIKEAERQKAQLGVSFEKSDGDVFGETRESKRGWRMYWGPFRGQLMRKVPTGVLRSHLRRSKPGTDYRKALFRELAARESAA